MFSDLESFQNYLEIQREIIFDYLLRLQKNDSFKYCLKGNLVSCKIDEGHFTSSFIVRAFIHLNMIENIDKKDKEYYIATINKLQNNDGLAHHS
jgi:prenyltransferase beta subunit